MPFCLETIGRTSDSCILPHAAALPRPHWVDARCVRRLPMFSVESMPRTPSIRGQQFSSCKGSRISSVCTELVNGLRSEKSLIGPVGGFVESAAKLTIKDLILLKWSTLLILFLRCDSKGDPPFGKARKVVQAASLKPLEQSAKSIRIKMLLQIIG